MSPAPGIGVATVVARNFLPAARVMVQSLRRRHPELAVTLLLTDPGPDGFCSTGEPFEVVTPDRLLGSRLPGLCFRYNRKELAVALKPFLLRHLLQRGEPRVLFLDPDLYVLGPLDELLAAVSSAPLVLTPHLVTAATGPDALDRERRILHSGVFNGGVVGVAGDETAGRFLDWWCARLATHSVHQPESGLCYDQRWLDLAPGLVPQLRVLRDERYNVAYWNLPERLATLVPGAAGCRLLHLSGFDPRQPAAVSRFPGELPEAALAWLRPLLARYAEELLAAGYETAQALPYAYAEFDNGVPVPEVARELYRDCGAGADAFGNPFNAAGPVSFFHWLNGAVDSRQPLLSRLWRKIHQLRPDLQAAFPDPVGSDCRAYLRWARACGAQEHAIDSAFLPQP